MATLPIRIDLITYDYAPDADAFVETVRNTRTHLGTPETAMAAVKRIRNRHGCTTARLTRIGVSGGTGVDETWTVGWDAS